MEQAEGYERRWWVLAVLCLSLLVIMLDNTIVNVALPTLIRELHSSNTELQWVVDAYILVFAGLLLTMGTLSDRFGRRHALAVGLAIFGAGSALSAFAPSPHWLITYRALMGLGGALIMPSQLSIISNVFPRHERGRAIGIWAGVSAAGIGVGPVLGGWLLERYWWGSIFLVNVPVVVIALVVGFLIIPNSRDPRAPRLDPVGVVLSIVGVVALVYAIIEAPLHGWTSHLTLGAFAGAVVVLIAFAVWELRIDHPMMNIGFFSNPRFTAASVSLTLVFFALLGSLFLLTQYLQFILGYTPFQAGVRVIPMAVALMVVSPLAGRLVERVGNRVLVGGGLAAAAGGLYYMSRITPADGYGRVLISLIVLGVGLALTMVPATESIMGSLPPAQAGIGSAMNDTTRQLGAALGVAVLGSLWASSFSSSILSHLSVLPPDVVAAAKSSVGEALKTGAQIGGPAGFQAVSVVKDAFIHAMDRALEIGSVVALGGAAVSALWLPSRARAQARLVDEVIEPEAVPVGGGTRGGGDRAVGDLALSPSSHDGRGQSVPGPSTQVAAAAETGDARLSLEPMYATVEAWVTDWFVPTFGDRLGAEDWCPRWWEHAEAVIRLESLWRPWEVLRLDPAMGMATWLRDYLQPQWEVLIDQFGPLRGCDHNVRNLSPSLQQTRPLPASFRH